MPAFFYLASFLAYALWRESESSSRWYLSSLALFFVALFTKQNTITMVATLAAYDVMVRRKTLSPLRAFVSPYVPFALMTAAYLWVRYALFGQVAREGSLGPGALVNFAALVERHLAHVVTGNGDANASSIVMWLALVALAIAAFGVARDRLGALLYFGPVWWTIGVAPVAVAGYSSPRHVYLAAVGWAIVLAIVFDRVAMERASTARRRFAIGAAAVVLAVYVVQLHRSVRQWNTIAEVSRKAARDAYAAALAAPPDSLVVLGAPARSWEWALPFAVQPPFAPSDATERVTIISPRALTCCAPQWLDETRDALTRWASGPNPDTVVALRWNEQTGELHRATTADKPELPILFRSLRDTPRAADLDTNIRRMLQELTK